MKWVKFNVQTGKRCDRELHVSRFKVIVDHRKISGYQSLEDALIEEGPVHRWPVEHISLIMKKKMERRRHMNSIPVVIYHITPPKAKNPALPTYSYESKRTKSEGLTLGSALQVRSLPISLG